MYENVIESRIVVKDGRTFKVEMHSDYNSGPPWDESDCVGVVSSERDSTSNPWYWPLGGRRDCYWYDVQESMVRAIRQQWGIGDQEREEFHAEHGRQPTPDEVLTLAVLRDYEYLKGYIEDDWGYVSLRAVEVDPGDHDEELSDDEWLGGIEHNWSARSEDAIFDEHGKDLIAQITFSPQLGVAA